MIVVNGIINTSAAAIAELADVLGTMESKSRVEDGCLDYVFSVEVNRPDVLRITEKWESREALAAHFQQPHMAEFRAAISDYPTTVEISFYEASEIERPAA